MPMHYCNYPDIPTMQWMLQRNNCYLANYFITLHWVTISQCTSLSECPQDQALVQEIVRYG